MAKAKKTRRPRRPTFKPVEVTTTVDAVVDEAFSEFEGLAEEMRSWSDNMEEKLSHTEKYERVSEAADTLENINRPDVGEKLTDIEVKYMSVNPRKLNSRAARRDNATYLLGLASDALNDAVEGDDEIGAGDLASELDQAKEEADGVEFPGMYG